MPPPKGAGGNVFWLALPSVCAKFVGVMSSQIFITFPNSDNQSWDVCEQIRFKSKDQK